MRSRLFGLALLLACGTLVQPAIHAQPSPTQYRPDVSGREAAVVSDHPLATAAGYEVLRRGGNAVDAAVTVAGVLAVVRPHMNGVGGDAFGLFYDKTTGQVTALNGSGRTGALATPAFFAARGHTTMPQTGALTITVPGAVAAWEAALTKYGTITLAEALAPAIRLAADGWVVTSTLEREISSGVRRLNDGGRAGALLRNPALAATLTAIARGGADAFYRGPIADTIARFVEAQGGYLRAADFRAHTVEWVNPITLDVAGGRRVHAMPPNSQGVAQLQQLALAEAFDLATLGHNSADYLHTLIETKRLAFADRDRWVADPRHVEVPVDALLNRDYLRTRASRVGPTAAATVTHGFGEPVVSEPASGNGDTVYLMVVDRNGNAVSWIQSLFASFGSGLVEPHTGVVLHNRGAGFELNPRHPSVMAPGKRPFHTLTPMIVTDAGGLRMTLGSPGGHGQPQFLTQVYHNIFTFGMSPQRAVEAPRFIHDSGVRSQIEDRVAPDVLDALRARGHRIDAVSGWTATFGGVQVILIDPVSGARRTGADPRREAYALPIVAGRGASCASGAIDALRSRRHVCSMIGTRPVGQPTMISRGAALLGVLLGTAVACSAPPADAPIESPEWGMDLRLVPEARVGVLDGAPEYELGRVAQLAVGADDAFVVGDDAVPAVRIFDSTGRAVRVIGRVGDGPGEYRSIGGVRTLPDGRIVLWDNRRRLLTTYSDTGAVLSTAMVPSGLFGDALLHVERDGTAWVRTMLLTFEQGQNPLLRDQARYAWVRVSSDGVVLDTVVAPASAAPARSFVLWSSSGYDRPFTREVLSTVTVLGELVSGDNASYAIERRAHDGSVARIARPHQAVSVGAGERAEWEAWAAFFEEQERNRPTDERVIRVGPVGGAYVIPAQKPAYRELLSDLEGRLWVRRYVVADSVPGTGRAAGDPRPRRVWREPSTFDVFERDGTWLGTVTLPPNTRFAEARGRRLWVIGTGEQGEDIVVRYRIESP
ncbi:MAG: gamma-glutamyltransferase [Gemmatimonadaceae bacterium]|nr:gamma-glutamyltransferase [Gemmatimonadaceae bacterium]